MKTNIEKKVPVANENLQFTVERLRSYLGSDFIVGDKFDYIARVYALREGLLFIDCDNPILQFMGEEERLKLPMFTGFNMDLSTASNDNFYSTSEIIKEIIPEKPLVQSMESKIEETKLEHKLSPLPIRSYPLNDFGYRERLLSYTSLSSNQFGFYRTLEETLNKYSSRNNFHRFGYRY